MNATQVIAKLPNKNKIINLPHKPQPLKTKKKHLNLSFEKLKIKERMIQIMNI